MLFNKKFTIVENRKNGVTITHYLNGRKNDVNEDIESFKKVSNNYVIGKKKMVVWVD